MHRFAAPVAAALLVLAGCNSRPAVEGGGGGTPVSGVHTPHLTGPISQPLDCSQCHAQNWQVLFPGPLARDNGANPSYDTSTHTCSNVYCHAGGPQLKIDGGSTPAPIWNPPSVLAGCNGCHATPGGGVDTSSWHPVVAIGVQCALCHPGYTNTTVDKTIHVNGKANLQPADMKTTCAACHGDQSRPVPAGQTALVQAAPPADRYGNTSTAQPGVGAHQRHLIPPQPALSQPVACSSCHVVPTNLAHVGPARDTPATVDFSGLASANGASPVLVPPPPGGSSFTCSNVYCHAGGPQLRIGGGTLTTPTWNPPSAIQCGACHALPGGELDTASWHPAVAANVDCGLCHTGYTRATVNSAVHVNGEPNQRAPNLATNCSACHGDPTRELPQGVSPLVLAAPPVDRFGSSDPASVGVGAHQPHLLPGASALSQPVACSTCHTIPTDLTHVGPDWLTPATVDFSGLASANGAVPVLVPPPPGGSSVTCSNVYCHAGGPQLRLGGGTLTAPTWNPPSVVQCGSCHALPGGAVDTSSWHPAVAVGADCGLCHPGYSRSTVNVSLHVNGQKDLNSPDLGTSCTACHGVATRTGPAGSDPLLAVAPPVDRYGNTATTAPGVGAHQSHLAPPPGSIVSPIACTECHSVPTNLTHVGPQLNTLATFSWGPLASAAGASPSFAPATLTCANYCHGQTLNGGGSNTSPKWNQVDGTQASCGTCHGSPPTDLPHYLHVTQWSFPCSQCHPDGYSISAVGANAVPYHVNGVRDVNAASLPSWNPNAPGPNGWTGTSAGIVGQTTGCHGGTRYWKQGIPNTSCY